MTTTGAMVSTPSHAADGRLPWYELIDDSAPPEDAMQQDDTIMVIKSILWTRYASDPSILVAGPTNIVYDSNVPGSFIAPDCYVVFGVDTKTIKRERRSYRIDEWGVPPAFVAEVASEITASRDLTEKREIYANMGVQEYWRFDGTGDYYGEPLVGERLLNGIYERYELHTEDNGDVWAHSEALGLDFYWRREDEDVRFLVRDSDTGEWLNFLNAEVTARQAAEALAQAELEARREAEARNRELEAELEWLRLRRSQQ